MENRKNARSTFDILGKIHLENRKDADSGTLGILGCSDTHAVG
jgi:hypothetical protein